LKEAIYLEDFPKDVDEKQINKIQLKSKKAKELKPTENKSVGLHICPKK
jgi:hypothetical protein